MTADQKKKKTKRSIKTPTLLRGFKDVLPQDSAYWQYVHQTTYKILEAYSYQEIMLPILEQTALFKRSIGEHTDIVSKEMFTFEDRGGDSVTLRPEFTASMVRAYIEHGMVNQPQPVRLMSWGPAFRYDRPQAGRFRQFNQLDIELLGYDGPAADAEIIFLAYTLCTHLGLEPIVKINSLGNAESRADYIGLLKEYYKSKKRLLCEDCKVRMTKNPLRVLDCKEPGCRDLVAEAPQLVDHIDEESKEHFVTVLEHLDESAVPYELDPFIVRGLDYYNRTAFELIIPEPEEEPEAEESDVSEEAPAEPKVKKQAIAIGGGGRYDGLFEVLGGRPTPAVGMAFGLERVIEAMKQAGKQPPSPRQPQVFIAQLGEEASKRAPSLFETLRQSGIRVKANFTKEGLKQQLELADKLGVPFAVILGQKELLDGTVIIRDMENGIQEVVDLAKVCDEVKKRLKQARS